MEGEQKDDGDLEEKVYEPVRNASESDENIVISKVRLGVFTLKREMRIGMALVFSLHILHMEEKL